MITYNDEIRQEKNRNILVTLKNIAKTNWNKILHNTYILIFHYDCFPYPVLFPSFSLYINYSIYKENITIPSKIIDHMTLNNKKQILSSTKQFMIQSDEILHLMLQSQTVCKGICIHHITLIKQLANCTRFTCLSIIVSSM